MKTAVLPQPFLCDPPVAHFISFHVKDRKILHLKISMTVPNLERQNIKSTNWSRSGKKLAISRLNLTSGVTLEENEQKQKETIHGQNPLGCVASYRPANDFFIAMQAAQNM